MNKALHPILSRLQSLQTASVFAAGRGRKIAVGGLANPVRAVLRELNETVLGRSLTFASDEGLGLTLEVAGRRVLRLTQAQGIPAAESCLAAAALEDHHKDVLIDALQALARPGPALWVQTAPLSRDAESISVGLPVALLADLLLVDLDGPTLPTEPEPEPEPEPDPGPGADAVPVVAGGGSILDRFARANGPLLLAWLIEGGPEAGAAEGPEEMVSHLRGFLSDEADALSAQFDLVSTVPGMPVCIALGASLDAGHSILCARSDGATLLGVIEGNAAATILRAWSAALG